MVPSWSGDGWSGDYHVYDVCVHSWILILTLASYIQVAVIWSGDSCLSFGAEIG